MITYIEAIRNTLWSEMERDDAVFLMGEDIGVYGGAFKLTAGFLEHFGAERVIDTPISEAGLVGAAVGASLYGRRPIVEMQFIDFISCAFNPIINLAAKLHYRTGQPASIVVRGPSGGGLHAGPYHSQCVESYFLNVPGLKIAVPASIDDAVGLLRAAVRDPNPVLFFEQKYLYRRLKGELRSELEYPERIIPLGSARVARPGRDLTLVSWGSMVHRCLEAAELLSGEDGVELEVIDLRTLAPLDADTVIASVKRTNRALVVHEAPLTGGFGGEIVSRITEGAFEWLDAPIHRLGSLDVPIPYAGVLEDAAQPQVADISRRAREVLAY